MKKRVFSIAIVAALLTSTLFSSCIGSFSLSKKLLTWNQGVDNKFVNWIIFVLISPAYCVTLMVDSFVINSIEFWRGENPLEAGIIKEVKGEDGKIYTVETLEDGYKIENEAGELVYLVYDFENDTWSSVANGVETKLLKFEENNIAKVFLPSGEEREVELSEEGVLAFEQYVSDKIYLAEFN